MNAIATVIAANIAAAFVIYCGIKLFDIGSDFADFIRRYGVFLGIVIAFVTIFNFLLVDTADLIDDGLLYWTVFVSMICFAVLGRIIEASKRIILERKKKKKKQISVSSLLILIVVELAIGVAYGLASGMSFMVTTGTGVMVLCSVILLRLMSEVSTISRFQEARLSRGQNILITAMSLCAMPISAILVYLFCHPNFRSMGVYVASATGFLVYVCLLQITTLVVKKYKNR